MALRTWVSQNNEPITETVSYTTEWLRENSILEHLLNDSNYQNLIGISEEIGIGNIKSDRFNCDLYEKHLRDLRRIADLIGEEDVKQEIDWFFLLPFDVANCNPVLAEESKALKKRKCLWERTLFEFVHKKDCQSVGHFFKKEASKCYAAPEGVYYFKCHGQPQ